MPPHTIIDFFLAKTFSKLSDLVQMRFIKDLVLLITKGYMPYLMFKIFGCLFVMCQCDRVRFPSCKRFVWEHIPNMLVKVMEMHVPPTITTFDLQVSKTALNAFTLVIKFINDNWVLHHVTIGFFEAPNTFGATWQNMSSLYWQNINSQARLLLMLRTRAQT